MNIQSTQEEIVSEFSLLDGDPEMTVFYIMELGQKLSDMPEELKTDDNIILLKTNMGAGHGGSSGRYDRLKEVAFDYAYALTQVGITK